ncbi:MAG TPA: superoxide dismutase, Ni [Candidatus Nealsonbacteria bacterium]|nr:superoxide dismutase, Ni [Candidatus Nealsonbacteria bacterium]HEB46611.1 superoxide dismutase, Ni [Candidatus Nealsonbacteria bacterium]
MINFFPKITAQAHCDIPCSIYEPTPAKIAAKTVLRMVEQLEVFRPPKDSSDAKAILQYHNTISRRIAIKEEHAQICKKELYTLWSDFFKPEHLEKFPNLHDLFWQATKLCSKNKQEINKGAAEKLVGAVDEIAKIFYEVKNTPARYRAYKELTDKLY